MSRLRNRIERPAKRGLDIVGAVTGLVASAPLLVGCALAIRRELGSPVLFRQQRPGKDERIFELIKFRTMRPESDEARGVASDGVRLTTLGRRLRAWSLDELPTLWNVLRGDMSLVGPRPLLVEYLDRYSPEQRRRHDVRPGVTGWAQIHGRNALSWEEKFALDVWYVENWSFWLDLQILVRTVTKVLKRQGISAPGEATMPVFVGSGGTGECRAPAEDLGEDREVLCW